MSISGVETAIKGEDKVAIESTLKELEKASMELGKVMYEEAAKKAGASGQAEPKPGAPGSAGSGGGKDDVIDAEYEVKD